MLTHVARGDGAAGKYSSGFWRLFKEVSACRTGRGTERTQSDRQDIRCGAPDRAEFQPRSEDSVPEVRAFSHLILKLIDQIRIVFL